MSNARALGILQKAGIPTHKTPRQKKRAEKTKYGASHRTIKKAKKFRDAERELDTLDELKGY